ITNKAD
ncbi:Late transcription factor VLTF-4 (1), partial [Monkeypox virus]